MVDALSQFRMRYVVEVPDDCENPTEEGLYPCTPEEYAMDTVTCEDAKEFTQEHMGEMIIDAREVTLEQAIAQFRKEQPMFDSWPDETVIKNHITPIGHSEREKMAQEEASWGNND
jgi:hypothetical protein